MHIVIFGLAVSSSWGNGHATLWRGLCRALAAHGHQVSFFERDVPYYAAHRDLYELPKGHLVLYREWKEVLPLARAELSQADVAIVTSYCFDAIAAGAEVLDSKAALRVFYDLDTPVTLATLTRDHEVAYIGPNGLCEYDLVLSYTGGRALEQLVSRLGARQAVPLYGCVDPLLHHPVPQFDQYRCTLSYLGTYAQDRQHRLERLLIEPAQRRPDLRFLIGGTQYPAEFPWTGNIHFVWHVPPPEHAAFFCSSRLTLNVTRAAMAEMGYCPSGRLFEAAACGVPVISDVWPGIDTFFTPGSEIIAAEDTAAVLDALQLSDAELQRIAERARERVLDEHTANQRAVELEHILERSAQPSPPSALQTTPLAPLEA